LSLSAYFFTSPASGETEYPDNEEAIWFLKDDLSMGKSTLSFLGSGPFGLNHVEKIAMQKKHYRLEKLALNGYPCKKYSIRRYNCFSDALCVVLTNHTSKLLRPRHIHLFGNSTYLFAIRK
jgi:hypothetical protein